MHVGYCVMSFKISSLFQTLWFLMSSLTELIESPGNEMSLRLIIMAGFLRTS